MLSFGAHASATAAEVSRSVRQAFEADIREVAAVSIAKYAPKLLASWGVAV